MNKNLSFYEQRNQSNTIKIRQVLHSLPDFCYDFFVGVENTTSTLTRLNYAYDLRVFFEFLLKETNLFIGKTIQSLTVHDLEYVKASHIERFLSYISHYEVNNKDFSNGERGKARKLSTLKSFFKYFFKKDLITSNVVAKVDMPKIHQKPILRLEADEVAKMLTIADEGSYMSKQEKAFHNHTRVRDVAILTLMLGTGIRVSECVGLNINDVDFETNGINITRKGGNQEVLYFSDEIKEALFNYLDQDRMQNKLAQDEPALFLSLQNRRISVRAVEILVKKYAKLTTPLKKITPHKLRTTYGTALYRETQDIYIVADVLGHKDVNTTKKHYAAISEDLRRQAANKVKLRED